MSNGIVNWFKLATPANFYPVAGKLQPCDREAQFAVGVIGRRGAQPLQGAIEVAALDHVVGDGQPCRRAVAVLGEQAAQQHLCMQHLAAHCMFFSARPSWIARPSCLPVGRVHSVRLLSCVSAPTVREMAPVIDPRSNETKEG